MVALLAGASVPVEPVSARLAELLGPVERVSAAFPFPRPAYYEAQMGRDLVRRFLSFARTVDPGELLRIKRATNELEARLALGAAVARPVNLDPGYVSRDQLVLASTKPRAHRVYLGEGIHAEVTLVVRDGRLAPLAWTYEDFRSEVALEFFERVRQEHLAALARRERPKAE